MKETTRILVVANETVGGRALIRTVKSHAAAAHARDHDVVVTVICPQNTPRRGLVVYEDSVRQAAEHRLTQTLAELHDEGVAATGAVMDPDPMSAVKDAIAIYGADEIIVSTHPETRSGWMRRNLVERLRRDTGLAVEHVVVDLDLDRQAVIHTLVVANQTVGGEPLLRLLEAKAVERPHRFTVICPRSGGDDPHRRLQHTLDRLHKAGLEALGQVMDPDPFTAVQNALQFYAVDEIVISTFPATRSGWLRNDLIERVRASTARPVEHVVVTPHEAEQGAVA